MEMNITIVTGIRLMGKFISVLYNNTVKWLQTCYPSFFNSNVEFNAVLHNRNNLNELLDFFQKEFSKVLQLALLILMG